MTLRPKALPRALVVPSVPLRVEREVGRPGRVPALRGRAVAPRTEPLRVSPLPGFRPSRNTAKPAAPAVITQAALPIVPPATRHARSPAA